MHAHICSQMLRSEIGTGCLPQSHRGRTTQSFEHVDSYPLLHFPNVGRQGLLYLHVGTRDPNLVLTLAQHLLTELPSHSALLPELPSQPLQLHQLSETTAELVGGMPIGSICDWLASCCCEFLRMHFSKFGSRETETRREQEVQLSTCASFDP